MFTDFLPFFLLSSVLAILQLKFLAPRRQLTAAVKMCMVKNDGN